MLSSSEKASTKHGKAHNGTPFPLVYKLPHRSGNQTMSSEMFSLVVWFWHDLLTNTTKLKVVRVDTSEEVHLSDGSFLLRISRDKDTSIERCLIRHIPSGREAHVQGGQTLRAFVKACLLSNGESDTT